MRRHLTLLISLLWMIACGQAGGGSGELAEGGIGGSGISTGPITEFGSIFVNGIEWFLDDAQVDLDGEGVECSDDDDCNNLFRLGMVVRVEGEIDSKARSGRAQRVHFDDEIEGPVSEIAEVTNLGIPGQYRELTILGQRVRIEAGATRFDDDDDSGFGFNTIAVGDVVEVSGLADQTGVVYATYVERKGELVIGMTEVEIKGTVAGLSTHGATFTIGSITIDFDPTGGTTDLSDVPGGVIEAGDFVEVKGILSATNRIIASRIELEDEFDDDEDSDDYSITGFVQGFTSIENLFFVGNVQVDASGAEFEHGTASMLENGRRVEVEGELVGGVLIADEVEFEDQEIKIAAAIASPEDIDTVNGRLVLLGIQVRVIPSTQFEDSLNDDDGFGLEDLTVGDFVKVEGIASSQGIVTAFEVERDEVDTVVLQGPVDEIDRAAGEIVILGVHVPTSAITKFKFDESEVPAQTFFERLIEGDFVKVKDESGSATVLDLANEIELEGEDQD